ncbi:MAG TPA: FkbM family methyltransferase [Chloroflexia bacterium]|nr:FkbM family methyltransferase [Chloroflexia bacterium]
MQRIRRNLFVYFGRLVSLVAGHGLGRFRGVRAVHVWLYRRLKPASIRVKGFKLFLDPDDKVMSHYLLEDGRWEPLETGIVESELKEGDVVLDIGANIGYYTILAARRVGPSGRVFAFEPDPRNFSLLQKNLRTNGCTNVHVARKAVSDFTGTIRLYLDKLNKGDHAIYDVGGRQSIEVGAVRLDDYFSNYGGKIDLIKIDVQGAEGKVLRGMHGLLERNKQVRIITEFWPHRLAECGTPSEEFVGTLTAHGFTLYNINEESRQVERITAGELLGAFGGNSVDQTNILCKITAN